MTRKDYELIAGALAEARPADDPRHPQAGWQHADDCRAVANALTTTNPRFDHDRFLAACQCHQESAA